MNGTHDRTGDAVIKTDRPREQPLVSVIVPLLNAAETVGAQLAALADQDYSGRYEVLVADNGSTDGSQDEVTRYVSRFCSLTVLDASQRCGVSHARNVGLEHCRGNVVLTCDADDIVSGHWITAMVEALAEYDIVGGAYDQAELNSPQVVAWHAGMPKVGLPIPFGVAPVILGANFGGWASAIRNLEGWNDRYVGGGEDLEFSWKAQEAGYRLGFAADAVVHYRHRQSLRDLAKKSYRNGLMVPQLMAEFRHSTLGRPRFNRGRRRVAAGLIKNIPAAFVSSRHRGLWVKTFATSAGVLVGSLRRRLRHESSRRIGGSRSR